MLVHSCRYCSTFWKPSTSLAILAVEHALLSHSLLQPRKPSIVLLPLGLGFDQQGVDLLLRSDHYPVIVGDDQVAIPDEGPADRDRAANHHRALFV